MATGRRETRLITAILLFIAINVTAQIGGDRAFSFLHLSPSARLTGLGGIHPALMDDDPLIAWQNPAALHSGNDGALSFNHSFFPAGIQHSSAMYAQSIVDSSWTAGAGVQYLNYGSFDLTDPGGADLGTFKASDLAVILSLGHQIHELYFVGANVKFVHSQLESYSSNALLFDLSGHYYHPGSRINISLTLKNVGVFLSRYAEGDPDYRLPTDLVIGFSKRLEHLPFRFGVSMHHLYRWNISYDDPNDENNTLFPGALSPDDKSPTAIDNFFRHFNFNGEFLLGKKENFRIRLAYGHLMRQELQLATTQTLAGFSFGFGMRISRFRIDYGRTVYHLAGGIHHLSLSTRLTEFF